MAGKTGRGLIGRRVSIAARASVLAVTTLLSACSSLTEEAGLNTLLASSKPAETRAPNEGGAPQTELGKATEYWGKEYAKSPSNAEAAVAYAKNLKAIGNKQEAFNVLQQAAQTNPDSKEIASEYGRVALELDKVSLAAQMLEFADDPMRPDWRVISARGAALAKLGKYKDAVQHLERANMIAPDQPTVKNNLALAYAMNGDPAKAEDLLRQVVARDGGTPKARQNLALVLGLQGKYDEATQVGSTAVAANVARENTKIVRQMVKLEPKSSPPVMTSTGTALASRGATEGWTAVVDKQAVASTSFKPARATIEPPAAISLKPSAIETTSGETWDAAVVSAAQ
jgi:Flp pilus assembly protein TadD